MPKDIRFASLHTHTHFIAALNAIARQINNIPSLVAEDADNTIPEVEIDKMNQNGDMF